MPICKGCGAPIIWIKTAKGKSMPVDAKTRTFYTNVGVERFFEVERHEGHEPHWATCPMANQFKKKKGN